MREDEQEKIEVRDEPIDIKQILFDLWRGFKKFWWIIPITTILLPIVVYGQEKRGYIPLYSAQASFIISENRSVNATSDYDFYYDTKSAQKIATTFPYIINSSIFKEVLQKKLGTNSINGNITVDSLASTNLFTISVISTNQEDAMTILNAVMEQYPQIARYIIGNTRLELMEGPIVGNQPFNSLFYQKKVKEALLFGVILGILPIIFYALTRKEIHKKEDITEQLNATYLGSIPRVMKKRRSNTNKTILQIADLKQQGEFYECLKLIASRVRKTMEEEKDKVLMVTSTVSSEGKSMTSYNLAYLFEKQEYKVVMLGGDFRKQEEAMKQDAQTINLDLLEIIEDEHGINQVKEAFQDNKLIQLSMKKQINNLVEVIASDRMSELFQQLRQVADYIIVDTPPTGLVADAVMFSQYVDGVVYIIRKDYIGKNAIIDGITTLCANGVKLYGCILNYNTEIKDKEYYSTYTPSAIDNI